MESLVDRALYSVNKDCSLVEISGLIWHFRKYSKEDVLKIASEADNFRAIKWLPLSFEDKVKCIVKICERHNYLYDMELCHLFLMYLSNKRVDLILSCLKYFKYDCSKVRILKEIRDEKKRLLGLNYLKPDLNMEYFDEIVQTIKNKESLIITYKSGELNYRARKAVILDMDDNFKDAYLNDFEMADRLEIIKSMKDDQIKKKYYFLKEYHDFSIDILSVINDYNFVLEEFIKDDNINNRFKLVLLIQNKKLKDKLIDLLPSSAIKEALKSNQLTRSELSKMKTLMIPNEKVDSRITFGVELECCGGESYDFLLMEKILNNWKVTADRSVDDGIEVISPVLKYDVKSLQELQYICGLLNRGEFYTDSRCGGHIHFGFSYFNSVQEFDTFLKFYCAIEKMLFKLSNKQGSVSREGVLDYAKIFKDVYGEIRVYAENVKKLDRYAKIVRDIPRSRYYALNIKNIGEKEKNTIEFRMPNGEINFNELILNILLFAKIMEKAKELNSLLNSKTNNLQKKQLLEKYRLVLNTMISNNDRVKILLDILFEDEEVKNKFLDRYNKNDDRAKIRCLSRREFIENDFR